MKTLVIFDSTFGNTKTIAQTIADNIGKDTRTITASLVTPKDLEGVTCLIVGSPIIGWRPSEKMGQFLNMLKPQMLKGVKVTSFDTRVKLFIHGDAAVKISQALVNAGGILITDPMYFYVKGTEGPLFKGEIEKASEWAKKISQLV